MDGNQIQLRAMILSTNQTNRPTVPLYTDTTLMENKTESPFAYDQRGKNVKKKHDKQKKKGKKGRIQRENTVGRRERYTMRKEKFRPSPKQPENKNQK